MKVPLADLRAQYVALKEHIDAAMMKVSESGCYIDGDNVVRLEEQIAEVCGARYGIGVASGTDALVLSLVASGIGSGDDVITTPFTFGATTEAIALVGARPVYVDIDLCTFNLDVSQIEARVTPRTKAILSVDLFGQMADRTALSDAARKFGLRHISDAAQAIGARQSGQRVAETPDATTLSFYPTKNLGAFGDGGMVLTNDSDMAEHLRSLRAHGQRAYGYHERIGYCSRLDTMQAVILMAKLPSLTGWNEARRRNAERYATMLDNKEVTQPGCEAGNYHIYHQYTIRHPQRDNLQKHLKAHDVDTKVFYPLAMHVQPAYRYLGYREGDFPAAERATREVLSIPIIPELRDEQIDYVASLIDSFPA